MNETPKPNSAARGWMAFCAAARLASDDLLSSETSVASPSKERFDAKSRR
jgi:hypothetical protein